MIYYVSDQDILEAEDAEARQFEIGCLVGDDPELLLDALFAPDLNIHELDFGGVR